MGSQKKVTKEQLLKAIEKLEKDDNLGGFFVDIGLGVIGAGAAGAAGAAVATFGGGTALFGLIAVAPPVGLVVGGAAVGAAALVGAKRIFFDGTFDEGKKAELLRQLRDQLREVEVKEKSSNITDKDISKLIILLKQPIQYNLITPDKAQQLIDAVKNGQLPVTEAYQLVENLLK